MGSESFTYRVNPAEKYLIEGARLVCFVSQSTGFPDPTLWEEEALYQHTRERQQKSYATVTVSITPSTLPSFSQGREDSETVEGEELIVGHSLLIPAPVYSWENIPAVADYLQAGRLAEAGSAAVHPHFQRLGIASEMRNIRMREAKRLGLFVCVGVWEGSNSHLMYKDSVEWCYLGRFLSARIHRPLHRYVEARIFEK